MGEKTEHDRLVDAVLLGMYYDAEPGAYQHGEAQFIADIRIEYPEHVDTADRVAWRILAAQGAAPSLSRVNGRGE